MMKAECSRLALRVSLAIGVCGGLLISAPALANNAPDARDVSFDVEEDGKIEDVLEAEDVDNDPLSFRIVRAPRNGEATVERSGKLTYRPKKDWHGTDEFQWEVSDGKKKTKRKAKITVSAVNDPPTPGPAVKLSGKEDQPVRGQITGKDLDGDPVTYGIARRPRNGSVEVDERRGRFTYTPGKDFHGTEKFVLEVTDGRLAGEVPVTIELAPTNDPPTTNDENVRGREDAPARGRVRGEDIDGNKVTFLLATPPENGKVVIDAQKGTFVYTPAPNFNGSDEFEFFATDGKARAKGHVGVRITAVNDPPTTERTHVTTPEDQVAKGQVKAKDPDEQRLFFSLSVKPRKGDVVLERSTGKFNYTPFQDFHGKDKFSVDVGDGTAALPTWVTVEVTSVNDAPEAVPVAVEGAEDTPISGRVSAQDVDGQKLSYKLAKPPRRGTVTVAADGSFRYTPKANAFGEDSFQFEASDGAAKARGDVMVIVNPVNDAPTADDVAVATREEAVVRGQVRGADIDGDRLTFKLGRRSSQGKVSIDAARGSFVYTPAKDTNGSDSFSVKVSDGKATHEATVKVAVAPVNDAPVAQGHKNQGDEDTPITGVVLGTDVDPDTLVYSVASAPRSGKLSVDAASGAYTYEPKKDFNGKDSFRFQVSDGKSKSQATVSLTIAAVNDAPDVKMVSVKTAEDRAVRGSVPAKDIDRDTLKWSLASKSSKGAMVIDEKRGTFTYTPNKDANGDDSIEVAVTDGKAETRTTVSVVIAPVNDTPVAQDGAEQGDEDAPITGSLVASDVDPDTLSYSVASAPRFGKVSVDSGSGSYTYQPKENFNGADSFRFQVTDGKLKAQASVKLTVAPVNDTPQAPNVTLTTAEDRPVRGAVSASDVDRDTLTWSLAKRSRKGKVKLDSARGTFEYTPTKDENGPDSFSLRVSDGKATTEATVALTLTAVNDKPTASDHESEGDEDTPIQGQVTGSDVDPDTLTYTVATPPRFGKVKVEGGSGAYTYEPKPNYNGADSFRFQVSDGKLSSTGNVKLTIKSVNDPPVPKAAALRTAEDRPARGRVDASDVDRDVLTFRLKTAPSHGETMVDDKTGGFSYTPATNFNGEDQFEVAVTDGYVTSTSTVKVAIDAAPDAPVVDPRPVQTAEDTEAVAGLLAQDADGDNVTFRVLTQSKLGNARVEGDGRTLRFKPHPDATGASELVVEASDGRNKVRSTIPVLVAARNDPPTVDATTAKTSEETPITVPLHARDKDGDAVKLAIVTRPQGAKAKLEGSLLMVTPGKDVTGALTFGVAASDAAGAGPTTSVTVMVAGVNDAPVVKDQQLSATAGQPSSGTIVASDVDKADELTFSVAVPPARGRVSIDDVRAGRFTFTPSDGAKGKDSFRIRVRDRAGASATATVQVTVR